MPFLTSEPYLDTIAMHGWYRSGAQLGVQLIEDLDPVLDAAELQLAEHRADDPLDVALVVDRGDQLKLAAPSHRSLTAHVMSAVVAS